MGFYIRELTFYRLRLSRTDYRLFENVDRNRVFSVLFDRRVAFRNEKRKNS